MSSRSSRLSVIALVAMILGAVVVVYPYAYMVGSSMKTRKEFAEDKDSLIPARYQISQRLLHARGEPSALDWPGSDSSRGGLLLLLGRGAVGKRRWSI